MTYDEQHHCEQEREREKALKQEEERIVAEYEAEKLEKRLRTRDLCFYIGGLGVVFSFVFGTLLDTWDNWVRQVGTVEWRKSTSLEHLSDFMIACGFAGTGTLVLTLILLRIWHERESEKKNPQQKLSSYRY